VLRRVVKPKRSAPLLTTRTASCFLRNAFAAGLFLRGTVFSPRNWKYSGRLLVVQLTVAIPLVAQAPRSSTPDTVSITSAGLRLTALVWRPATDGPYPAVLFNHGSGCDADGADRLGPLFAGHGYAFFYLFRRGHGLSFGQGRCAGELMDEERAKGGVDARNRLQLVLLTNDHLEDVISGLAFVKSQKSVDPTRIIVAGHSFGGQLALLAAERDSSLIAALNFAGAANSWRQSAELRARLLEAIRQTVVPVFFIHAANDYSVDPGQSLAAEMTRLGKQNRLKIYPSVGMTADDGHMFVFLATQDWEADVVAFLREYDARRK
jgi:carboxymethylenebutenolidase